MEVIPAHDHAYATFMTHYKGAATVECTRCGAAILARKARKAARMWNRRSGPRLRRV